jgi:hypothetical protein
LRSGSRPAWALLGFAIGSLFLIGAAAAEDRRVVVDPNQPPWSAIVKVQTNIGFLLTCSPRTRPGGVRVRT